MRMNLAVILPERYRGGTLRGALNIARMLRLGAQRCGDELSVSFGHVDDPSIYSDSDFDELRALGIKVRPFRLETVSAASLASLYSSWLDVRSKGAGPEYLVFNDGISNFEEADFWLIVSDRLPAALPPHRRYAVVVYDYIQRYVPLIFGQDPGSDGNWMRFEAYADAARRADFVVCTTEQTRRDCINYVGCDPDRVRLFPNEFDPLIREEVPPAGDGKPYVVWTTNSTQHKNHLNLIEGLDRYFRRHPDSPLRVKMTGVYTHLFDEKTGKNDPFFTHEYPVRVRAKLKECDALARRLRIMGNLSDQQYVAQLVGAQMLLHGSLYDNGTYAVLEAAWLGVPSLSSDYPAMREIEQRYEVPLTYFQANSPRSLAESMEALVARMPEARAALPTRDRLSRRSFEATAPQYWETFRDAYEHTALLERHAQA